MADTAARLALAAWRNDDAFEVPIRIVGADFTNAGMTMQIRLRRDTPGEPEVWLNKVDDPTAEGLRVASVTAVNGIAVTDLRIRVSKSTLQGMPYSGELGDSARFEYALLIAGKTRLYGTFDVLAHAYGSDGAPTGRPLSNGLSVRENGSSSSGATLTLSQDGGATVVIDGADVLGGEIAKAQTAADEAEAARDQAVAITPFLPTKMPPDSGYAYALVDANGRAALIVRNDGRVMVAELSVRADDGAFVDVTTLLAGSPKSAGPDSGVAYAIADANGRSPLIVRTDGSTVARFSTDSLRWLRPDDMAQYPALGSPDMVAWGDSLSEVGSGGDWQGQLATRYRRWVEPRGIGGQTSTMIGARADAIQATVTVSGGQLAGSGKSTLTAVTPDLLAHVSDQSIEATIYTNGVPVRGLLHRAPDGVYDFTRTTPGAAITVPAGSRLRPDIAPLDQRIAIIRVGQNDIGNGVANAQSLVLSNSAAIVRRLVSHQRRFLIVGLHMGGGEVAGSPSRVAKEAVNAEWARLYGDRFVDVNWYLINRGLAAAGVSPTSGDNEDIAAGIVPRSLRSDQVHFTSAGGIANAAAIAEAIERNGF